jgi:hypothetical protein
MKIKTFLFACVLCSLAGIAQSVGVPYVAYVSGNWGGYDQNGISICSASSTSCVNELLAYAIPRGYSPTIFGQGQAVPITVTNATLDIPPMNGNGVSWPGMAVVCDEASGQDCLNLDTMLRGNFSAHGGTLSYCGAGKAVHIQPRTPVAFNGIQVAWTLDADIELPTVLAPQTGCAYQPLDLIDIDVTSLCTSGNEYLTSALVNSTIRFNAFGNQQPANNYAVEPVNCQYQLYAGNTVYFDNEGAAGAEFRIGNINGTPYDGNLGSNHYVGTVTHTASGSWTWIISSAAGTVGAKDRWDMIQFDTNEPGSQNYQVYWGPNACGNLIVAQQVIPAKLGTMYNNAAGAPGGNSCGANVNTMQQQ